MTALFHKFMLRNRFAVMRIRLLRRARADTSDDGSDLVANGCAMPELDIDLERVISDPAYRRAVLDYLKHEAAAKTDSAAMPAPVAEAAAVQEPRAK